MTETSSIIPTDASAITVDTSCIDVSEVKKQEDKDFLNKLCLFVVLQQIRRCLATDLTRDRFIIKSEN